MHTASTCFPRQLSTLTLPALLHCLLHCLPQLPCPFSTLPYHCLHWVSEYSLLGSCYTDSLRHCLPWTPATLPLGLREEGSTLAPPHKKKTKTLCLIGLAHGDFEKSSLLITFGMDKQQLKQSHPGFFLAGFVRALNIYVPVGYGHLRGLFSQETHRIPGPSYQGK